MIGVPSAVWNETKPWSLAQRERARTHPYLTERMLTRIPALASVTRCAAQHHERLDGSGYPHGLAGDALPMTSRILAVADVYHALRESRPHRESLSADAAAAILTEEARAGRLDGDAIEALLAEVGLRVRRPVAGRTGLTARETQVLVQLARGLSNPQIAAVLSVSRKTVSTHLEHIYTKLGVSIRTQAALFSVAGTFLECLATQDFARLAATPHDEAHLSALVPPGLKERDGSGEISRHTPTPARMDASPACPCSAPATARTTAPATEQRWTCRNNQNHTGGRRSCPATSSSARSPAPAR